MDHSSTLQMRFKRFPYWFVGIAIIIIIWKLCLIETNSVQSLHSILKVLHINSQHFNLSEKELTFIRHIIDDKIQDHLPTIYAITPTYWRYVQKAELTRISQTLLLVPNIHWIVVEDSEVKTKLVENLLAESDLVVTHLNAKTPPFQKLKDKDPRWKKHRGVEQRNAALKWLRDNLTFKNKGIVYFMDDDNTYSTRVFLEMRSIKKVGVWPVGLVGGLNAEAPILDNKTGKVTGYRSGWKPDRPFAIDMAGFAVNLDLILANPQANFSYKMEKGYQESEFLSYLIKKEELEPLADNCTKVYVWHTRTEKPVVNGFVQGLEV